MKILNTKVLSGPNKHAYKPVIEAKIDLMKYNSIESKEMKDFNKKLLSAFLGLKEHHCSRGRPGGFVERLNEGTYLGHVVEHLALELQACLGYEVYYGKTFWCKESIYKIIFEYKVKEIGLYAVKSAVNVVKSLIANKNVNQSKIIKKGEKINRKYGIGPSTKAILQAARRKDIPIIPIDRLSSLYQLGYGKNQQRIEATISSRTSCIGVDIACNKMQTKAILEDCGLPVPPGYVIENLKDLKKVIKKLNMPLVVKPVAGSHGKGVTLKIYNWYSLKKAYYKAKKYSRKIIVEEYHQGKDYRLLVVGGKMVAAAERQPPFIVGNGQDKIKELIKIKNSSNLRGEGHEKPLTKIKIDKSLENVLQDQHYTLDSIPEKDVKVLLRYNGNLSTGGTAADVTEKVHPENRCAAVRAARLIGLDIAGIDILTPDIRIPLNHQQGAIIEVNAAPGIRMHHHPSSGNSIDVAGDIINYLFPESTGRIPIIAVTGTNGKTTTTRLLGSILKNEFNQVGMTTTEGIYINDNCIMYGDNTGPRSAKTLLKDSSIDIAVLETARGGIIREGLGYKQSDIGVITNISEDHLGVDGLETLEDLVDIKSLIIETVKDSGYCILNADDPTVVKLAKRSSAETVFFSVKKDNIVINKHCQKQGKAVYLNNKKLLYRTGNQKSTVMEDITLAPICFGGLAEHNLENILAAAAVSICLGIDFKLIKKGVNNFGKKWQDNIGRLNVFTTVGLAVILDYGHNPAGFEEVFKFMQKLEGRRLVGIIGVPGDRKDELIIKSGETAGKYLDRIYIKEDSNLRGRLPGETAKLLKQGVKRTDFQGQIIYRSSEVDALELALKDAKSGDIIVCFYEKNPDLMTKIIRQGIVEFETREPFIDVVPEKISTPD
ncbi:MAG: cyanophycin synthetase [Halothermotrichaceae bacterium]